MNGGRLDKVLDYTTDVVGITGLVWLAVNVPEPSTEVVAAIATIALGQSYAKSKWDGAYGSKS